VRALSIEFVEDEWRRWQLSASEELEVATANRAVGAAVTCAALTADAWTRLHEASKADTAGEEGAPWR